MKKISLILLTLLSMSCQSQQKRNMSKDKIKFYPKDLVSIKSIPKSEDINSVELKKGMPSVSTLLSKSLFFNALDHNNTRILNLDNKLDAKLLADWSYSPWYIIDFTTAKGDHKIELFLGGLGFMILPSGKRGAVLFDFSDIKKGEEGKLIKYFDKLKREVNLLGKIFDKRKEFGVGGGIVTFIASSNTLKINNIYPHPSKEFSENFDIIDYQVKNNDGEISFWRADRQILKTNKAYPKMVADFVAAAKEITIHQGIYNKPNKLLKGNGNVLLFPDGLKIVLASFSHKKTFENQRSPAIAHLELSDKHSEEKWFTIRRSEYTDEQGKFITSYESKKWKNYNIELTGLAYDDYIDITITKLKDYNTRITLTKDETILFPDGLKIDLVSFSNKKTFDHEESVAIAYIEMSKNQGEESTKYSLRLSREKNEQGKLITSYESKKWKNYNIKLTDLSYEDNIEIIVTKKSDKNRPNNFMDVTNELSTDEFEQIKNFILKNKVRQTYRNFDNNNPHYAFIDFDLYLGADIGQKNMDNDPNLSDFNELTIKHNILEAPIQYYELIIVRKGDINNDKTHILEGMKEDKVYLVDLDKVGLDKLKKQLPFFLKAIKEKMNPK